MAPARLFVSLHADKGDEIWKESGGGLLSIEQNFEPILWKIFATVNHFNIVHGQILKNNLAICDQSYKHFTIVNYDSRAVTWGIFKSGTTLESYITIVEAL